MNGNILTKTFICTLRDIPKLDKLILSWESAFFAKHESSRTSADTVNDLLYRFMLMILTSPMDLRYESKFFYFQKNNDIIKISLTEFADVDYTLFLKKWPHMFKTKVCHVSHDRELTEEQKSELEVAQSEYKECLHNDVIETHFPHMQIIIRYICISLKKSINIIRVPNSDEVFIEDVCFAPLRNLFLNAAVRLSLIIGNDRCARIGKLMQEIIYQRMDRILFNWNTSKEVYPGYLGDHMTL